MAMAQFRDANIFLHKIECMYTRAYLPQPALAGDGFGDEFGRMEIRAMQHLRAIPLDHWTLRHGFYCIMGGFVISVPDGRSHFFPVNPEQLLWLIQKGLVRIPSITSEEIKDKSKKDSLAKTLAYGQTIWFVTQCIGRGIQGLPVSTLEIATVAYVACMLPAMLFWWRKPYDVMIPTPLEILHWPRGSSEQLDKLGPQVGYRLFQPKDLIRYPRVINSIVIDDHRVTRDLHRCPNWVMIAFTGSLFGGVHCIAWNFEFPTTVERWLWRASGVCIIIMAMSLAPFYLWQDTIPSSWKWYLDRGAAIVYAVLRLYLMVEVFLEFRAMSAGVYDTLEWTLFIPNI